MVLFRCSDCLANRACTRWNLCAHHFPFLDQLTKLISAAISLLITIIYSWWYGGGKFCSSHQGCHPIVTCRKNWILELQNCILKKYYVGAMVEVWNSISDIAFNMKWENNSRIPINFPETLTGRWIDFIWSLKPVFCLKEMVVEMGCSICFSQRKSGFERGVKIGKSRGLPTRFSFSHVSVNFQLPEKIGKEIKRCQLLAG